MALATSQLHAGAFAPTDIPARAETSSPETPEVGSIGPLAADTPAGHPAMAGSLTN